MKLTKAVQNFRELCPNPYPTEQLVSWIAELDGMVILDVFASREGSPVPEDWTLRMPMNRSTVRISPVRGADCPEGRSLQGAKHLP